MTMRKARNGSASINIRRSSARITPALPFRFPLPVLPRRPFAPRRNAWGPGGVVSVVGRLAALLLPRSLECVAGQGVEADAHCFRQSERRVEARDSQPLFPVLERADRDAG